jgi:hypothetical protein
MQNCWFWVVAVYGPNTNDVNFFRNLSELTARNINTPFIIGGDFNCTISNNVPHLNLDVFDMQNLPSLFRTNLLHDVINTASLTDPFRALWPLKKDFTYIPRTARNNRSHIDFFLISECILSLIQDCEIGSGLLSSLFDHKPIFISIGTKNSRPATNIFTSTINHRRFHYISTAATVDCFLIHADPGIPDLNTMKKAVGNVLLLIRELNDLEWTIEMDGESEAKRADQLQLTVLLDNAFNVLPGIQYLSKIDLVPNPDTFFEI